MGLKVDLQGFIGEHSAYALKARFDSLSMADSRKTYTLGSLDIDMASDLKKTTLDVKTGDLQLTFRADTSLAGFGESAGKIAGIVGKQIAGKDIDMEQIKAELPGDHGYGSLFWNGTSRFGTDGYLADRQESGVCIGSR